MQSWKNACERGQLVKDSFKNGHKLGSYGIVPPQTILRQDKEHKLSSGPYRMLLSFNDRPEHLSTSFQLDHFEGDQDIDDPLTEESIKFLKFGLETTRHESTPETYRLFIVEGVNGQQYTRTRVY